MMTDSESLPQLITQIYDAAIDQELWPDVLENICGFVGGPAAMLFAHDISLKRGHRFHSWGDDPNYTRLYFERYAAINPVNPAQLLLELGAVKSALDLVPRRELVETRFYREWALPQGYVDNVFVIVDKSSTSYAAVAVSRDEETGVVDDEARRRMSLLAPHLRRAVLIGNILDLRIAEAAILADMIDALASAVYFVDAGAHIVYSNAPAQRLLADGKIVRSADGTLGVVERQADVALRKVFSATANGDAAVGTGGIAILLSDGAERWLAHVLPLTSGVRRRASRVDSATAVVFVRRAAPETVSSMETIARLHRLTASELRVLQSLVEGGSVRKIAQSLGISDATVKTHLQNLFKKTGMRRQIDLVKLVAGSASPFRR
jgi:DNA-binding CsgD family transcriptional regulator